MDLRVDIYAVELWCKDRKPEEEAMHDCEVSNLWELVWSPLSNSLARD